MSRICLTKRSSRGSRLAAFDQRTGLASRRQSRTVQRFAHIDIAKSGDDALVEQRGFERCRFAGERRSQEIRVELIAKRLDADILEQLVRWRILFGKQVHHAEAPGIGVNDARAVIELEKDVIMRTASYGIACLLVVEFAQIVNEALGQNHGEAPGHAKMNEQAVTAFDIANNILGPPPQAHRSGAP